MSKILNSKRGDLQQIKETVHTTFKKKFDVFLLFYNIAQDLPFSWLSNCIHSKYDICINNNKKVRFGLCRSIAVSELLY